MFVTKLYAISQRRTGHNLYSLGCITVQRLLEIRNFLSAKYVDTENGDRNREIVDDDDDNEEQGESGTE